jgi:hypothetical protein
MNTYLPGVLCLFTVQVILISPAWSETYALDLSEAGTGACFSSNNKKAVQRYNYFSPNFYMAFEVKAQECPQKNVAFHCVYQGWEKSEVHVYAYFTDERVKKLTLPYLQLYCETAKGRVILEGQ